MKRILYILTAIMPICSYSQDNLTIKGSTTFLKEGTEISLNKKVPARFARVEDIKTTKVKDHKFEFSLKVTSTELYYLIANNRSYFVFLGPGSTNITLADSSSRLVSVTDHPTAVEYNNYHAKLYDDSAYKSYYTAAINLQNYARDQQKKPDSAVLDEKKREVERLQAISNTTASNIRLNWIAQHPNSYINGHVLYDQIPWMPEDGIKKVFQSIPAALLDNSWGKELKYKVDSLFIGGISPDFLQADSNGRQVSLASFRGKYVLIDFWASWCIPCRQENPTLVKAMTQFKDLNFTILSISLDDKKEDWLRAIKQDSLNWQHVSELNGWKNTAKFKYYISAIPGNFLINPEGKIIAKNLYGDDLLTTIAQSLK